MLDLNALAPVSPQEFSASEDLPIRQLLRRFGERRLGEVQESNALTGLQERLALLMEARARRNEQPLTFFGDGAGQSGRRSLHLDVGARYLPLKVDVGFGRYGDFQTQTLFPTGGGQYRLDAALLKLWVEEEIQAMEQPWVEAQVAAQATSAQARPVAALPSPDRAARPASSSSVAVSLPPAVRDALEPRRQELRRAMLQAVQGDVRELARLTHGAEVQAILNRLQARAAQQAASRAPASAQGEPLALGQAQRLEAQGAQDPAALAPTALRMEDVAQLRPFLPTLSVDAADPSFSFERAAETILQSARGLAARAARGEVLGLPESKAYAPVGAQAHEAGRFAQSRELSRARMFGVGAAEVQAVEAMARAMTPFADTAASPHLPALRAMEQAQGAASSAAGRPALGEATSSLSSSIAAALDPQGAPRRALGELGLKALELRPAAPKERAARRWLTDGGRGVLLDGLDGAGPSRKPTAAQAQPSVGAQPPLLEQALVGAQASLAAPSAPARGLAAVLEALTPPSLAQPWASYPAGVSARAVGAWTPELASPGVERRAAAGTPKALGVAAHPSYDATARGDFASVVARAQLLPWAAAPHAAAQAAARLESRFAAGEAQRGALPAGVLSQGGAASLGELGAAQGAEPSRQPLLALASEGAWSPVALSGAQGLGATPAEVLVQDVAVSGRYLPSLARALEQIGHSAERAARLLPGALGRDAHLEGALGLAEAATGQEVGALGRLHEALRAVRAGLQDAQVLPGRLAELATRFAEVVREGQEAGLRGPSEPRRGYQGVARWAQDLTPLRMEALAQPKAAAQVGEGWSAQAAAQFVAQAQAQVQSKAAEQIARLSQVVSQAQAREEAPRALGMFSPEKTLSMLAPQLESGGLLDATSRRELSAALESLSHAPSAQPRRVRTPFGTLSVKLVGGQVVVDAEEASSLSPSVSLSRRAAEAPQVGATAPTRQVEALAAFASPAGSAARVAQGEAGAWQRIGGAALGALARQALGAVEGVELLLGAPGRAERGAGVVLEPVAGRGAEGLAGLVAARGAQGLGSAQVLGGVSARGSVRHEQAGEVIRVHAGSQRAAEVLQALRRRGVVVSDEATGGLEQVVGAEASAGLAAQARVVAGGRLAELLARPEGASVLRSGDPRLSGKDQPAAVEAAGQRPLERLLAEAADARAIGALGKVGMARPAFGALSRADLAHVLPFLQREAAPLGVGRASGEALGVELGAAGLESGGAQPQGAGLEALLRRAGTTPEVLSRALGLASVAELAQVAQRMGLSGVGVGPAAEAMPSLRAVGRPIGGSEAVGALGERVEQPGRAAWSRVPSPEATLVQAQARVEGEQARLDRISRRLEGRPSRQPLQAQALSGVLLRELSGVRELVEQLGGPQPQRLKARLEAAGFASARGGERGELVQLAGLRGVLGGERGAQEAGASVESRAGRVGIWMPLGVERLVSEGAEALVGAQGGFEGAFVAPRLFQSAGQRGGARGSAAASLGGRAPWREVGGRMGLGLVDLKPGTLGGAGGFLGAEGVGELPAIGAGNSALNQAPWMTSTQALTRMEQIVSALQQSAGAQQAVARRGGGGELTLPSLPASPDAVISGRGAGGSAGGYGDIPQPPRELYRPPYTAQAQAMPANQAQGGQGGAAGSWGQPPGQQGFAMPRASMDQQNAPEVRPERGGEHPYDAGEMPTQQHIEDLAHEVLETLKRKWAYELERRGTE